ADDSIRHARHEGAAQDEDQDRAKHLLSELGGLHASGTWSAIEGPERWRWAWPLERDRSRGSSPALAILKLSRVASHDLAVLRHPDWVPRRPFPAVPCRWETARLDSAQPPRT